MNSLNNDMVLWGVIICVVGAVAVVGWLFFMAWRNAMRGTDKK